jgi:hypothetical protein
MVKNATDFKAEARLLGLAHRAVPWSIGDLLVEGEKLLKEKVWQYVDAFGISESHLQDFAYLAKRFPRGDASREFADRLSIWHYREVVSLPPSTQRDLLERAVEEGWSTKELRRRKSEWRKTHGKP